MTRDLQWFKFSPLNWMTGRIRKEPVKIQIAFIEIICQYWKNGCSMTIAQAELEIGSSLKILMAKQLIKPHGDEIRIQFLDEQMVDISDTSAIRRDAALHRWNAKASKSNANGMHLHKGAMQSDADKRRQDKMREDRYSTPQEAFEDISNNYEETEPQRSILANRGWKSVGKPQTDALLFHFLSLQNLSEKTKTDLKGHFKAWLNKIDVTDLQQLATKIHERHQG